MNLKKLRTVVTTIGVVLFVGVAGALGYCRWSIQTGLNDCCTLAQSEHPHLGDDVAAMMDYVQSESHSLRERNLVVWALGQARDSRALPILESYYTGQVRPRPIPLPKRIGQSHQALQRRCTESTVHQDAVRWRTCACDG